MYLSEIETSQGGLLIAVHSVAEAQAGDILLLKLILNRALMKSIFVPRELVLASKLS